MSGFTFNGVHSKTKGIKAIRTNGRPFITARKHRFIDVPYRDSSYLIADNSKPDITIKITMLFDSPQSPYDIARAIDLWLNVSPGKRLIFDDDPNYAFSAILTDAESIPDDKKVKEYTVSFRCNPNQIAVGGV